MTTRTLTGQYPAGYTLKANYSILRIDSSAVVKGAGVTVTTNATVFNSGYVANQQSGFGMALENGGSIVNETSGFIAGRFGVFTGSGFLNAATVTNYGVILGSETGIDLTGPGGAVRNVGEIAGGDYGVEIAAGAVVNTGEIYGGTAAGYQVGVLLENGADLTNGSLTNNTALVSAANGVIATAMFGGPSGSVVNFGSIEGLTAYGFGRAVTLQGASLTNGAATDLGALVLGDTGVVSYLSVNTITNFGAIKGSGSANTFGVYFEVGGGVLTNGSTTDKTALVQGYTGVRAYDGVASVSNFGTIEGTGSGAATYGVILETGGQLINGAAGDKTALVEGRIGLETQGAASTVKNFATILATGGAGDYGVVLQAGGGVTNGSAKDTAALIEGRGGLEMEGGTAVNFGRIEGTGAGYGLGALLADGASLTNGSASDTKAVIEGFQGVFVSAAGSTVTNFGTLWGGGGGPALSMNSTSDTLVVEAGSSFIGAVEGGGGTLVLASGVGTLTGLLVGGNVTVSGSMATTTFTHFGTVEVGAGATFTAQGASALVSGQTVIAAGALTLAGGLTSAGLVEASGAGTLTILGGLANSGILEVDKGALAAEGAVTGAGTVAIKGGTVSFASSFDQNVTFTKSGALALAQSQSYGGTISGFSKTGATALDLGDIGFVSAGEASFSGNAKSGVLTVTDGVHTARITLTGNYKNLAFVASDDHHGGVIVTIAPPQAPPATVAGQRFVAAMAGLSGGGPAHAETVGEPWRVAGVLASPVRTQTA